MRPVFGTIGVPTFGKVTIEWAMNFHHMGVGLAVYVSYLYIKNKRVDIAKNEICEQAVKSNADWVFLLDDDVLPPQNTLMKMIRLAFGPPYLDVINGVYWSKSDPPMPLLFRGDMKGSVWNWHVGDLIKIDAAGAGCTFIKTKVLKALKKPWFNTEYTYTPLDPSIAETAAPSATEDLYFYKKVRDAGFQVWADTSIQCVHEDRSQNPSIYYGLPPDYPQAIPGSDIKPRGKKLILDIGSGGSSPYFQEGVPVRLDFDEKLKPDIVADWHNIPEPDRKYDIVFASHALEHNPYKKVLNVLKEWLRVLKVGGKLILVVPNLQFTAKNLLEDKKLDERDMWILYSAQKDEYDYHMSGFTPRLLKEALEKVGGLKDIKVWTSNGNWSNWRDNPGNYNILATAIKEKHLGASTILDPNLQEYSPEESETRRDFAIVVKSKGDMTQLIGEDDPNMSKKKTEGSESITQRSKPKEKRGRPKKVKK